MPRLIPALLTLCLLSACGLKLAPTETGDTAASDGGATFGDLSISPAAVDFGGVNMGEASTHDVVLKNLGSGSLVLLGIEQNGDTAFTIESEVSGSYEMSSGEELVATVRFAPTENLTYAGSLDVSVAGLDAPASVPLTGDGLASSGDGGGSGGGSGSGDDGGGACTLSVSPTTLDFGEVSTSEAAIEGLTLSNSCADAILLQDIVFSDDSFSYSGVSLPQVINSGSSKTVDVVFEPHAIGTISETMTLTTDEASGSPYTVNLTATATEPDCYICDPTIEVETGSTSAYEASFTSLLGFPDTKTMTIRNASDVDLRITGYSFTNDTSGGTFTISGLNPVTISPWGTSTFTVSYVCTASLCVDIALFGNNELHIASSAVAEPDYVIKFSGGGASGAFAP